MHSRTTHRTTPLPPHLQLVWWDVDSHVAIAAEAHKHKVQGRWKVQFRHRLQIEVSRQAASRVELRCVVLAQQLRLLRARGFVLRRDGLVAGKQRHARPERGRCGGEGRVRPQAVKRVPGGWGIADGLGVAEHYRNQQRSAERPGAAHRDSGFLFALCAARGPPGRHVGCLSATRSCPTRQKRGRGRGARGTAPRPRD